MPCIKKHGFYKRFEDKYFYFYGDITFQYKIQYGKQYKNYIVILF